MNGIHDLGGMQGFGPIEREENEEVVRCFLESNASFRLINPNARLDLITTGGFVRTFPHRHGCDGFFAAVLESLNG